MRTHRRFLNRLTGIEFGEDFLPRDGAKFVAFGIGHHIPLGSSVRYVFEYRGPETL